LNNNKSTKIAQNKSNETTQFDATKMFIPEKAKKTPDFNLLATNDPKQIDLIYQTLKNHKNEDKVAQFMPNDTALQEFRALKDSVISKAAPILSEGALKGWDNWTGPGIARDAAFGDDDYLQAKALWEKRKKQIMESRNDGHLSNVILSDKVSKASSKYIIKWQPDWVNIGMYRYKMDDTMGREWNLSTEFFHTIRPEHDIPNGYIVKPTQKQHALNQHNVNYIKTKFGKNTKHKKTQNKIYSIYKQNAIKPQTQKDIDCRPQRDKI